MKAFLTLLLFIRITFCSAQSDSSKRDKLILINNVEVFNGKDSNTIKGNVLVVNNLVSQVSTSPIITIQTTDITTIDGKGKFLMPGLIDAHTHIMMESVPMAVLQLSDIVYITSVATKAAENNLMQGFTTIRDMGGPAFGLKRAIDQNIIPGPRVYPSGAIISQTGGHGDFLLPQDVPRDADAPLAYPERNNVGVIADGVYEVTKRVREQLRLGATQIKLAAGGGSSSNYDPLDVSQYSEAEFAAAVNAAENWNTYVAVHAYTPRSIQTALKAGVRCIEHGQLMDEASAKMIAEKKAWLCMQPFLPDDKSAFAPGSANFKKQQMVRQGTDTAYQFARKYKLKTAFGTDCLFDAVKAKSKGLEITKLSRWYSPFQILNMLTAVNAGLVALCGPRNPYPNKLGVIEEGAYADMILVDGNVLQNIQLLENPYKNFLLIMKNGVVYKNSIQ